MSGAGNKGGNPLLRRLEQVPRWLVLLICYLLVGLLGYVDYLTGDYSVLVFYLIPIFPAAWLLGSQGAWRVSLASGVARVVSDYYSYADSTLRYWNSLQDAIFLFMVGFLIVLVKRLLDDETQP
jgi:hypothetical protein